MKRASDESRHSQPHQVGAVAWYGYCVSEGLDLLQVFVDLSSWLESKV